MNFWECGGQQQMVSETIKWVSWIYQGCEMDAKKMEQFIGTSVWVAHNM